MSQPSPRIRGERFLKRFQKPFPFHLDPASIYLIGDEIDDRLWLLYETYPPAIAPVDMEWVDHFLVFASDDESDLKSIANVWHHSSRLHPTTLKLYTLKDLIKRGLYEPTT